MERQIIIQNEYDTNIVKCCLSCKHIGFDIKGTHKCKKGFGRVVGSMYCDKYAMKDILAKMGNPMQRKGGIKKPHYFSYMVKTRMNEAKDKLPKKTLEQIQEEYEEKYGSIWLVRPPKE